MQFEIRHLWGKIVKSLHEALLVKCDIGVGVDPRYTGIYSHLSFPVQGSTPLVAHYHFGSRARHQSQCVNCEGHSSPPKVSILKINTDGSSQGNPGPTGIGGVRSDRFGDIQFLFSIYKDYHTNNLMEALAILVVVELCFQLGWKRILCETDSRVVVNLLNSQNFVHVDWHLALILVDHSVMRFSRFSVFYAYPS